MRLSIYACAAAMLAVATSPALGDDMKTVSCSGFDISYSDPAAKQTCAELDKYGNQTEAVYKRLNAETDSYFLTVLYAEAKFHTYFPESSLRAQVNDANFFADTDNWLETREFDGFEIAAFNGYQKAGGPPILCAAFSRYSGTQAANYEYDEGPGFPRHAVGLYCAFTGQAALINPPDNFYRVVEDAIGKLQLPR